LTNNLTGLIDPVRSLEILQDGCLVCSAGKTIYIWKDARTEHGL